MKIRYISIFPEIFTSFQENGLIKRGIERKILDLCFVNPRHFTDDVHRTIDDSIYGGGHGMLMKAPPILDSLAHIIRKDKLRKKDLNRSIIIPGPSTDIFTQQTAHTLASQHTIIYICGRYEGIDHRVYQRCQTTYQQQTSVLSLGQFITLGGETPAMVMTEAITRLIP
jgi:tRNA (guanine37-N1)-methyltransferase